MRSAVLIMLLAIAVIAFGQTTEYPHTMDNGGGRATDATHQNIASIGQPVAGVANDSRHINQAGYITAIGGLLSITDTSNGAVPKELKINQNYPNPFNGKTIIEVALPSASEFEIVIYDTRGKVIQHYRDHRAAGTYKLEFDAANLPSGVYPYRILIDGSESASGKMVLAR